MAGKIARALEAGLRIRPGEQRRVALMSLYAANAIGAVVVGHSVLLKIGRDDFRDILGERPEIAMGVMKVLTRRLRETSKK